MRFPNTISSIAAFLAERRIALMGVSRHPHDFSRLVYREFRKRGYDIVPVNPAIPEIDGDSCFASLRDIHPPVTAALIMTPASATDAVVQECLAYGVRHIWLHRSGGQGSVTPTAVEMCREKQVNLVAGECPLMFLPDGAFFHRFHGFCRRVVGSYPAA